MPDGLNRPPAKRDYSITPTRIAAWILIGGTGIVLVIMGIVGIVAKG
jgi:hypothetical protein